MRDVLRNILQHGDLPFRDFVEVALYHPEFGYYTKGRSPVGPWNGVLPSSVRLPLAPMEYREIVVLPVFTVNR